MSGPAVRIGLYGFFGAGNLGNEATLQAVLAHLRHQYPHAELVVFGVDARTVERRHGVRSVRLMAVPPGRGTEDSAGAATKALSRVWDVPRTFELVGDIDVLVVAGTGILEASMVPRPWGMAYWTLVWAVCCRLRRRRLVLLAVGAERPAHVVTRSFFRWTVRLSDWCSTRDEESADAIRALGTRKRLAACGQDVVFSADPPAPRPPRPGHVLLGVIAYEGSAQDPHSGPGKARAYSRMIVELVGRLVDEDGAQVRLAVGDLADLGLAREIENAVRATRPGLSVGSLSVSDADDLDGLMHEMASAEVVIASRFHHVLGALMACRPVIALGYAPKNRWLLARFGLDEYYHAFDDLDGARILAQYHELRSQQGVLSARLERPIARAQDAARHELKRMTEHVIGPARAGDPAVQPGPATVTKGGGSV